MLRRQSRLLLALLLLPALDARAQYVIGTRDSLTARVDNVFRAVDRVDSPGGAGGIYRDGRIAYARGYGMANLELGVPNSPRTVFDIGSVSKQFTNTAVLLLAQEGKLSLSDDVRKHFPELPPYAAQITIRQLMNHISGIRDYFTLMNVSGRSTEALGDTLDFLRVISRSATTNFPIGSRYLYSNSGYVLLGQLVYRVSGKALPVFLKERVLTPLGMTDSRSLSDHAALIPNRAQGYASRAGPFVIAASQFDGTGGAGSMHATVEEFAHWDRNWIDPVVGGRALIDSLLVRGKLTNDSTIAYALGVTVDTYRGLRTVSHGGSWAGYRAHFLRFPDERLSVATFCNLTSSGPDTLTQQVAAVYLGAKMSPDTIGVWERAVTAALPVAMTAERLQAFVGVWRNVELGEVRRTRIVGDSLMSGVGTGLVRMIPLGGSRFRMGRTGTEVTFDSAAARLSVRTRGGTTRFERIPGMTFTPAQLAEYAGEYRNDEIETTITFVADSGRLLNMRSGRRVGTFEPVAKDFFVGNGVLEFARDGRGRITGYLLQSGRVRHLKFVRIAPRP